MRLNFIRVIIAAVAVIFVTSCSSEMDKLLKSDDHQQMYYEGLNQFKQGKYNKAIVLFSVSQPYLSGSSKEDSVAYFLGTSYYKSGDFTNSEKLFGDFRRTYARSPFLEDVEYMYTMSFYYSSLPANRDQTMTERARIAMLEYLARYPQSIKKEKLEGHVLELTERLHEKEYLNSKLYYNIGQYKSAVVALQNALDKYPESRFREELMFLVLKSNYLYAKNSFEQFQRDRFLVMMDAYYNYTAEYPETKQRKEADKMQEYAKQILAKYNTDNEDGTKEE